MSRRISRTVRATFAALVAAGLTFGAGSVLASPTALAACPYDPSTGKIGRACPSTGCATLCTEWYGSYNPGHCIGGCCVCNI
jgi:hypothetical protein